MDCAEPGTGMCQTITEIEQQTWLEGLKEFDAGNRLALMAVFAAFGEPISYLDVGCGTGAMVKLARQLGIKAHGVDLLLNESEWVRQHDLSYPFEWGWQFDLVTSIEVAEHIQPEFAETFCEFRLDVFGDLNRCNQIKLPAPLEWITQIMLPNPFRFVQQQINPVRFDAELPRELDHRAGAATYIEIGDWLAERRENRHERETITSVEFLQTLKPGLLLCLSDGLTHTSPRFGATRLVDSSAYANQSARWNELPECYV